MSHYSEAKDYEFDEFVEFVEFDDKAMHWCGGQPSDDDDISNHITPYENGHFSEECTPEKCVCVLIKKAREAKKAEELWKCFSEFWKMISSEEE